jgi:DNA-binding transcriptional regulator LsrR (DeoR family)
MKTRIGFLMLKRLEVGKGQATKDELAEFCGTSRFYLKEMLDKLQARGIITIEKDAVRAKSCAGLFMRGNKLFLLDEQRRK